MERERQWRACTAAGAWHGEREARLQSRLFSLLSSRQFLESSFHRLSPFLLAPAHSLPTGAAARKRADFK